MILNYIKCKYNEMLHRFRDFVSKNKIYRMWIFMFSALVIFLTIMGGIFYYYSTKNNYIEQEKSYIARLEYIKNYIDDEYNAIQRLVSKLYMDEGIKELEQISSNRVITELEFIEMFERFRAYKELLGIENEYYIWFANKDLCLTSESKYDKDLFSNVFVRDNKVFTQEQLEYFDTEGSKSGYIVIGEGTPNKTMAQVLFMRKNGTEPFIAVIVPFSNKSFYSAGKAEELFEVIIAEEDGIPIFRTGESEFVPDFERESQTLLYSGRGNERMTYAYIKSDVSSLKYAVAMDYDLYSRPVQGTRLLFFLLILFEIMIVIFLLILFIKENYTPIKHIVSMLPHNNAKKNEYEFIHEGVSSLLNNYQDKEDRIEQQEKKLKYLYLEKIITDDSGVVSKKYEEYLSDMHFLSNCYCVILFYVFDEGVLKTPGMESEKSNSVIEFTLRNVSEELAATSNLGYLVEISGMYCCLLNYSIEKSGRRSEAVDIACQTVEFLKKHFELGIKAFVGQCVYGIDNIGKSYDEVVLSLEKGIYDNDSSVVEIGYNKSYENEDKKIFLDVIEYINEGDEANAVAAVVEMFSKLNDENVTVKSRLYIINDFLLALVELLQNASRGNDGAYLSDIHLLLKTIHKNEEIASLSEIQEIIVKLCKCNYNKMYGAEKTLYINMKKYIDERCCDCDLNSGHVADKFNVSINYFLRFFKNNSGISFIEYIHTMRIKKAMELIDNSNAKIEEIYISCGYNNYDTFSRAFKKNTGMRPTEYRNRIK